MIKCDNCHNTLYRSYFIKAHIKRKIIMGGRLSGVIVEKILCGACFRRYDKKEARLVDIIKFREEENKMKKMFSMIGMFLLFGFAFAYADEMEVKDKDIAPPEPQPIPIEIQPQLRMIINNVVESRSTSTARGIRNCNIEFIVKPSVVILKNTGTETCRDFIAWGIRKDYQSSKYYINGLRPSQESRIFTDTTGRRYDADFWGD